MATNVYVNEVAEKLKNGVKEVLESGQYKSYLKFVKSFYNYSYNNIMLIFIQKPDATLVAGYNTWKNQHNRYVKKGEKAIKIFAPILRKSKREKINSEGKVEEEEYTWYDFRVVNVFDISQTEGDDIPTIDSFCKELNNDIKEYDKVIRKLEEYASIHVDYVDDLNGANGTYNKGADIISIRKNMSQAQTIKTLVHEIAHSKLHCKDGIEEHADRSTKELQAESVAFIVCDMLGIDTSDYSFGYIASWSEGKNIDDVQRTFELILGTAKEIITGVAE